jgi:5'-nucleotidase
MCDHAIYILVTNDDGIEGPGLWHLAGALSGIGRVLVVAPLKEQSGAGTAVTYRRSLKVQTVESSLPDVRAFAVDGTPADCVIVGLRQLREGRIGLIAAGINPGPNLGNDIFLSGTVGAALQGGFRGISSFAISLDLSEEAFRRGESPPWETAQAVARLLGRSLSDGLLAPGLFLNVNVPALALSDLRGVEITRVAPGGYLRLTEVRDGSRGRVRRQIRPDPRWAQEEGTDVWALRRGCVSISPLRPNLTAQAELESLRPGAEGLFTSLRNLRP